MPSFVYQTQTAAGHALAGSLTADDQSAAQSILESLQLRVISLAPDPAASPARSRAMSAADFQVFNLQLAHLASAGLPIESGLRLISAELGSPRLASAARQVADELERGVPLADAFARHQSSFTPLYARLVNAGVQTNNLPAILLSLSRHLELVSSLRSAIWRALLYPYVLFVAFQVIVLFLCFVVIPAFRVIFTDFRTDIPFITEFMFGAGPPVGIAVIVTLSLSLLLPIVQRIVARVHPTFSLLRYLHWVPVISEVSRQSLRARWCDALQVGINAGLPLPQALEIAAAASGGPEIDHDTAVLATTINSGGRIDELTNLQILPPALVTALQLGIDQNDLPRVLLNLTDMYQQQARQRISLIPAIFTPASMIIIAGLIGSVIVAMFLPLIKLIVSVTEGD